MNSASVLTKIITENNVTYTYFSLSAEPLNLTIQENENVTIILHNDASAQLQNSAVQVTLLHNARAQIYLCVAEQVIETITIELLLLGNGAAAEIKSIIVLDSHESVSIKTVQRHSAPHAQSQVIVKALLADYAQLKYEGLISVDKQAHNTHAAQQNKNMLLSEYARAYARPSLEVHTNEVKCFHGSATGPLDNNQLLYLLSRGIEHRQARRLLMQGFVADVLQGLPSVEYEEIVEKIMKKIEKEHDG